jgi:hypothetical protein
VPAAAAVKHGTIRLGASAWSPALTVPVDDVLAAGAIAGEPRLGRLPVHAHRALDIARRYAPAGLFPRAVVDDDVESAWEELVRAPARGVLDALAATPRAATAAADVVRYFDQLDADGVPELFLRSAGLGQERKVSIELAPYLERLTFRGDGSVVVPSWLELAAWALDRAVRDGPEFTVATCELCGVPWLRRGSAKFCRRLAPGSWQTCAQLGKVREHRRRKKS